RVRETCVYVRERERERRDVYVRERERRVCTCVREM
ncbi:hypothetical protein chiPu_0032725, partial [Chiloscyllium punctatum]|nr:hypothetical protein [Chiloscyllium punctatum]